MVNRRSGESSLYIQLFNQLKEELKQKRIGEKIDSELDLMDKYNVSRGTVRHAIEMLVETGDLYKIHGKGTFRGNGIPNVDVHTFVPSFTSEMISNGRIPTISDVTVEEVAANLEVATYLKIEEGTNVWKLTRYRGEYGVKPYYYASAYILKTICPNLKATDLEMSLVSMVIDKFHLPASDVTNIVSLKIVDKELSEVIGIPEGTCTLKDCFVLRDIDQNPVVYDVSYIWKEGYEFIVRSEVVK